MGRTQRIIDRVAGIIFSQISEWDEEKRVRVITSSPGYVERVAQGLESLAGLLRKEMNAPAERKDNIRGQDQSEEVDSR